MLEMLILPQRIVQVPHAHREMPLRQIVDHLGRDGDTRFVALSFRRVLGRDAGEEAHREMFEDGQESIVFV